MARGTFRRAQEIASTQLGLIPDANPEQAQRRTLARKHEPARHVGWVDPGCNSGEAQRHTVARCIAATRSGVGLPRTTSAVQPNLQKRTPTHLTNAGASPR